MENHSEVLTYLRRVTRLYDRMSAPLTDDLGLSRTELDIVAFLMNHPQCDTARDIVARRMLQKSNVSQAVEQLIRKGLLCRRPDAADRRCVHLLLTARAGEMFAAIRAMQSGFRAALLTGLSEEEQAQLSALLDRVSDNAAAAVRRLGDHD